ncbi:MAG: winged helix-turn-helix domain-containing protein [Aquabacterium sp.]|nr:winged helix-turn-helix domain-containing protein [Aquabacterium sp.]
MTSLPPAPSPLPQAAPPGSLRFGRFELQLHERRLLVDGEPVLLGGRALDVLTVLAERAGSLVTKNELLDRVWPGLVVEEHNIVTQVSGLRKVLGGDLIATIPGRGYRFTARVERGADTEPAPAHDAGPTPALALRTNLPATLPPLIGRDAELRDLQAASAHHRIVTVLGAGGTGKTLLTQHLLRQAQGSFEHGVCLVDLAPVTDAGAVAGAVAAALGLAAGWRDPLAGLCEAVAPLRLLLVLDNAEHLLDEVARVVDALHRAAPDLRMVITSQAPLRLSAEHPFRLGGLALPPPGASAAQAAVCGAVALFVERARTAARRFELNDETLAPVLQLCRQLDGSALAIEMAAARLPLLGLAGLVAALDECLALLTNGQRDRSDRQQALRAMLDWTHALLTPAEQKVFRRLAVFVGSARLAAAQEVAMDDELDAWAVLDALAGLVDRSLVALVDTGGEPRYRLLESPRAYALQRLQAAGEAEPTRMRHLQASTGYFLHEVSGIYSTESRSREARIEALRPDFGNGLAAFGLAAERGDTLGTLRLGWALIALMPFSMDRELQSLVERCEGLLESDAPAALRAELCFAMYPVRSAQDLARAERIVGIGLAAAREAVAAGADAGLLCRCLGARAVVHAKAGDAPAADAALNEAQALERPDWPLRLRICNIDERRRVAKYLGRMDQSLTLSRQYLQMRQDAGAGTVPALSGLADTELAAGQAEAAVRTGQALVAQLEGTREEQELAHARLNLCAAFLSLDQLQPARRTAVLGWKMAERFGMQAWWADYLALLAALEGRSQAAALLLGFADATYERTHDHREPNEAAAAARVRQQLATSLHVDATHVLLAAGALLPEAAVAALALEPSGP